MAITLTRGATTVTCDLVDGYTSTRNLGAIVHEILGSGTPEITDRPSALRSGRLRLMFDGRARGLAQAETDARDAEQLLAAGGVWAYSDSDRPSTAMQFVVTAGLSLELESQHRRSWWLEIPYQETTP